MTTPIRFWFACLCLLGCMSTAGLAVPPLPISKNLAENPTFEQTAPNASTPQAWNADKGVYQCEAQAGRNGSTALKFVNTDPKRYRLCVQPAPCLPGKKYRFAVWVKTQDLQGDESGATICLQWQGPDGKWLGGSFPSGVKGTQDWTHIKGLARVPKEATSVSLSCYVRKGMTGTAWFDDVELVQVADPPLATMLLTPGYRGRITAAGPKEIRLQARLNLDDLGLQPQQVRVHAVLCDATGGQRLQQELIPQTNACELTFPAVGLTPGRYRLQVRLQDATGKLLQETTHDLSREADDFQARSYIDEHRRLIVDGQPFFPLGLYFGGVSEKDLTVYAQSKFNCLMPYGSPKPEQMDLIQRLGLKVIYSVKDLYFGMKYTPKSITSVADEEPLIRQRVRQFRDHPALLAWYLNDELPQSFMPRLDAHQQWVAEEDPHHPTWVVLYQYNQVFDYRNSYDVIGTDPYPIGRKPASEAAHWTATVQRELYGSRAVWQVPQLHNWANYRKEGPTEKFRSPSIAEIRSMSWQCLAEGATGLIYYCWRDLQRNPDAPFASQWEGLKGVADEIDRAAPILLSIEPVPARIEVVDPPAWLHWIVRTRADRTYLFLVNDGDGSGEVEVRLPPELKQAKDFFADKRVTTDSDLLRLPLPALEVRAFEFRP